MTGRGPLNKAWTCSASLAVLAFSAVRRFPPSFENGVDWDEYFACFARGLRWAFDKAPHFLVAVLVGVRIAIENVVGHVGGKVPGAGRSIDFGDGQVDLGQVATVIAVSSVHGQDKQIALLYLERLAGRFRLAAEIDDTFGKQTGPFPRRC